MWPKVFVEDTVVREAGESLILDCGERACGENAADNLLLTLGITHATEQESIEVSIFDSKDGVHWRPVPLARFSPKYYCGNYQLTLPSHRGRYLRASWSVERWGAAGARPYFGIHLKCAPAVARELTAAAAIS